MKRIQLSVIAIVMLGSHSAWAASNSYNVNATGACAPTQPSYDAKIKRRPLGILNEGPGFVLIACSLPIDTNATYAVTPVPGNGEQLNYIEIFFTPFFDDAPSKTVSCNVIAGDRGSWKTYNIGASVQPGSGRQSMSMEFLDRRTELGSYNLLCQLPAGVEMGTIRYSYNMQLSAP